MLGRKTYTREELDAGREAVRQQLAAYRSGAGDPDAEAVYFNAMLLALDRRYVHRVRTVTGKDTNPLSEVEVLVDSLMADGVLSAGPVVKLVPEKSVLGLQLGDPIRLSASDFERLADAFLAELERRCLVPA